MLSSSRLRSWFPVAALLLISVPVAATPPPEDIPVRVEIPAGTLASPRLRELSARVQAGDRGAAARFWGDMTKSGTPLAEAVAAANRQLLVTFLWRGGDLHGVVLLGSIAGAAPLFRLAGTDIWYRSYLVRRDARFTYRLAPVRDAKIPLAEGEPGYDRGKIQLTAQMDPLNPRHHPPGKEALLSLVELPEAPPATWAAKRPGVPAGNVETTSIRSSNLEGRREIAVYTPPGYQKDGAPYPLLVVLDGAAYLDLIPLPAILDNLIAAHRIPPVVAVLVGRLDAEDRDKDLSCNRTFEAFLADEALPWAAERYRITNDPAQTVIAGSSLGGLEAACAAIARPERFGNVLAQSGAFQRKPEGASMTEWVAHRVGVGPRLPLRFYLDVGLFETWPGAPGQPSLLDSNRHLRDALLKKGYVVTHAEFAGGHGYANWQVTLPDGLIVLLGK
jgi:enterochelin esterase family protein